jgi:hypothetical protein
MPARGRAAADRTGARAGAPRRPHSPPPGVPASRPRAPAARVSVQPSAAPTRQRSPRTGSSPWPAAVLGPHFGRRVTWLPAQIYSRAPADDRFRRDERRLDYHPSWRGRHPALQHAVNTGRRLTLPNRLASAPPRADRLRCGTRRQDHRDPQLGKTQAAVDQRRQPRSDRFPVVYVTVPPAATPRMLAVELARFSASRSWRGHRTAGRAAVLCAADRCRASGG